jgi:hypothetical protein
MTKWKPNFKCIVLSRINKLEGTSYITEKICMSTFQYNWNHIKVTFVYLSITKTVIKGQN